MSEKENTRPNFFIQEGNQIFALFYKSIRLQLKQYITNFCQIIIPVIIVGFLLLLQYIFTSLTPPFVARDVDRNEIQLSSAVLVLSNPNFNVTVSDRMYFAHSENITAAEIGYKLSNGSGSGFLGSFGIGANGQLPVTVNGTTRFLPFFEKRANTNVIDEFFYDRLQNAGAQRGSSVKDIQAFGSYYFKEISVNLATPKLSYSIQVDNRSATNWCGSLRGFGNCEKVITSSMMNYINNIYLSRITGGRASIDTATKEMPFTTKAREFRIVDALGNFFFPLILSFLLPVFMYTIVIEKQGKLREMMKLMGMKTHIYFGVTYVVFLVFYLIVLFLFLALCYIFQFRFTRTHPLILFLLFFGWGLNLVSWSFFLAAFISNSLVATVLGYLLSLFGSTAGVILESSVFEAGNIAYKPVLLINPLPLTHVMSAITAACNAFQCPQLPDLINNTEIFYGILALYVNAVIYFVASLYFDAVVPQPWGIRKDILFPISWIWGTCLRRKKLEYLKQVAEKSNSNSKEIDSDVKKERNLVQSGDANPENSPVLINNLVKIYGRKKKAVGGISIALKYGEIFGLLGPNGAGKTTTISMLCGLFGPTLGTAYVNGYDISTQIDKVHHSLGLCPQFDVLWGDLTCYEHLYFFSILKCVPYKERKQRVRKVLSKVGLLECSGRRSSNLSGGMKRRLSIGIALVGDPKIVMLDEPTTGLDPTSKRALWDTIQSVREDRCIILTTHSMEEVEALCDRIGIMCRGYLKCVGSNLHLKNKFGQGFNLTVNFKPEDEQVVIDYFKKIIPQATIKTKFRGVILYKIKGKIEVSKLFEEVENNKKKYKIKDWAISQISIEDVFLDIVKADEDEFKKSLTENKVEEV